VQPALNKSIAKQRLDGKANTLKIEKKGMSIEFNKQICSQRGHIFGIKIVPQNDNAKRLALATVSRFNICLTFKQAHLILGHFGKQAVVSIAKKSNWILNLEGQNNSCLSCQIGKAKHKDFK